MTDKQIIEKRKTGDNVEVAEILGLTPDNVNKVLNRPNSRRYPVVIRVLRKIVEDRENRRQIIKSEITL